MPRKKKKPSFNAGLAPEQSVPEVSVPAKVDYNQQRGERGSTLKEIPEDLLLALESEHPTVVVEIKRRNGKGQLASLGYTGIRWSPRDVINVASWIEPRAGGGLYQISVTSVNNTYQRLLPPFEVVIEGLPRPPMPLHVPVVAQPAHPSMMTQGLLGTLPGALPAPAPEVFDRSQPVPGAVSILDTPRIPGVIDPPRSSMQQWPNGLHPQLAAIYQAEAAAAARQSGLPAVQLPPGASIPSDHLAMEQLRRAEARAAELDAQVKALIQRSEERERALMEQLREEREKAREQTHQLQLQMLQEQMKLRESTPKTTSVQEYVPLLAALAPVLTAMISSGKEQQVAMMTAQQTAQQQLMALIAEQAKKPQPDPLDVVEKLGPILSLGQKDPAANIAMMEAMGNMQLQMTGMMAQMIESFGQQASGDSTPAWLPIVQTIGQGLVQMQQAAVADAQRERMAQAQQIQQARALGSAPQQPQQVVVARPQQQAQQPAPQQRPQSAVYQTVDAPAAPAPMKLDASMLKLIPPPYDTAEWKGIIIALHEGRDPAQVGSIIARHIGHLDEFGLLPPVLENFQLDPPSALRALVQPLPVYTSNPAYVEQVIEATISAMFEHGVLRLAEEAEEETDDEEATDDDAETASEALAGALVPPDGALVPELVG